MIHRSIEPLIFAAVMMALPIGPAWAADEGADTDHVISLETAYSTHFAAYAAGPAQSPLGVLLIHDRWGLNDRVRAWADRIAGLGYRVIAIDLYDGRPVAKPSEGREVWRTIDPVWTEANVDGALAYLQRTQTRIVVAGWGSGIGPVGDLARRVPANALSGLILYYDDDTRDQAAHLPQRLTMPVLDISVGRSLVYPEKRETAAEHKAVEDVWDATSKFLARFAE
jgi:dienelactone hydrolase